MCNLYLRPTAAISENIGAKEHQRVHPNSARQQARAAWESSKPLVFRRTYFGRAGCRVRGAGACATPHPFPAAGRRQHEDNKQFVERGQQRCMGLLDHPVL